jgi:hypothetical protein
LTTANRRSYHEDSQYGAIDSNAGSSFTILEIKLKESVYGWFGGFKGMARKGNGASMRDAGVEKSGGGKNLPGGGTQFYIPNLKYAQVKAHSLKSL